MISLLDVPVFTATGRHLRVKYVFQVDGRAVVSERIFDMRYDAPSLNASVAFLELS